MKKVSIEVRSGSTLLRVAVRAESVRRAMELVEGCDPSRDIRVRLPSVLEDRPIEQPPQKLAA